MPQTQNDLAVLAPTPVEVVVGERDYVQKPLSLRGTASLVVALSEEMQNAATSPALAAFLDQDMADANVAAMVPGLLQVLGQIPNALPRIITIILIGHADLHDEADVAEMAYIDEHCGLALAMRIFRTFIEQNEPEELIENFMVLRSTLSEAVSKAKAKYAA